LPPISLYIGIDRNHIGAFMEKRAILLLLAIILLAGSVSALTFESSLTPIRNSILLNETAEFELTLRNDLPTIENFIIFTTQVEWDLASVEEGGRNPRMYPETSRIITLKVKPTSYITPGYFNVLISIKNVDTGELRTVPANVEIKSTSGASGRYLPGVRTEVHVSPNVDPREEFPIRINLINQNPLNISALSLELRSNIIQKTYATKLDPLETKTVNFNIKIDPLTPPQDDILYTRVIVGPHKFEPVPQAFTIIAYGAVKENIETKRGFFQTTKVVVLENEGNAFQDYTYRIPAGLISNIFTRSSPRGTKVLFDGKKHLAWETQIGPGESSELRIMTNYQYLIIALVLVLLSLVGYYIYRSPLLIEKSAVILGRKHGGISMMSVRMNVVNRSKYNVHDVKITDRLPNLVDLKKEFEEGTLRPSSILKHDKKGTIMKWHVATLEPGEERIIHYKVVTRLSILGSLTLPVTVARFKYGENGRERVVGSNRLNIRA